MHQMYDINVHSFIQCCCLILIVIYLLMNKFSLHSFLVDEICYGLLDLKQSINQSMMRYDLSYFYMLCVAGQEELG